MNSQVNPLYKYDKTLSDAQKQMAVSGVIRTCLNCANGCEDSGKCIKYGIVPPMRVIAVGCEVWELEIPF
jgi:hypothetical protein